MFGDKECNELGSEELGACDEYFVWHVEFNKKCGSVFLVSSTMIAFMAYIYIYICGIATCASRTQILQIIRNCSGKANCGVKSNRKVVTILLGPGKPQKIK